MRVLVCGSRHFDDDDGFFSDVLNTINESWDLAGNKITTIIHGGARGPDTLADTWARSYGIIVEEYTADWEVHGRSAGPIRNQLMLDKGKPDLVVAFWDGKSPGTKHMISIAEKAGVKVEVIKICQY